MSFNKLQKPKQFTLNDFLESPEEFNLGHCDLFSKLFEIKKQKGKFCVQHVLNKLAFH